MKDDANGRSRANRRIAASVLLLTLTLGAPAQTALRAEGGTQRAAAGQPASAAIPRRPPPAHASGRYAKAGCGNSRSRP